MRDRRINPWDRGTWVPPICAETFLGLLAAERDHHLGERQKQANYSQRHHETLRGETASPNQFTLPMLFFPES
jgi:hypothetical protein